MKYELESARGWNVAPLYATDPQIARVIQQIERDPQAPGHSDVGVRNLICSLVHCMRPRRVLEIGCHIGSSAVAVGGALRSMNYGHLFTLEPQKHFRVLAENYVQAAGLQSWVTVCDFPSTAMEFGELVRREGPFEIAFIDARHDYEAAFYDINACANALYDNGLMILHDTSADFGAGLDTTKRGGVRKAALDYCASRSDMKPIFFEPPLWLNPCGAALICKQVQTVHQVQEHVRHAPARQEWLTRMSAISNA